MAAPFGGCHQAKAPFIEPNAPAAISGGFWLSSTVQKTTSLSGSAGNSGIELSGTNRLNEAIDERLDPLVL